MLYHTPVLLDETVEYLVTDSSGVYFEGTIGFGGHTKKILSKLTKSAKYIGTDKDSTAYDHCRTLFKDDSRVKLFNTSFTNILNISRIEFIEKYDGIFADLGVSSFQLDNKDSGFTYRENSPLDLRMDKSKGYPASFVVNTFKEEEIANIIYKYGEERNSRSIAKRIVEHRKVSKIETTEQLRRIVEEITPSRVVNKSLSRIFQAFRIFVNDELNELEDFLEKSLSILKKGGRIVIITFHSLEDRIVKEFFKQQTLTCVCPPEFPICVCDTTPSLKILTKKPVVPTDEEIDENSRSRSAKLRVAEKI
ncbi:16S rRNA (cytosine(1402)-N(4))-methyltransferase [hydrothermal vent metagenome]|uniref:16S rRNA (Cytosine(1402)-N(4))-methyltransferase n=1 Tax=hydrothermal vent metagenome TaxID=652676 RepID=A0A3B1CMK2_9ZZZZ